MLFRFLFILCGTSTLNLNSAFAQNLMNHFPPLKKEDLTAIGKSRQELASKEPGASVKWQSDETGNYRTIELLDAKKIGEKECQEVKHVFTVKTEGRQPRILKGWTCNHGENGWKWYTSNDLQKLQAKG